MTYTHRSRLPLTDVLCPICHSGTADHRCSCGAYVVSLGRLDIMLTSNVERTFHHMRRASIVRTWRHGSATLCRAAKVPAMESAVVHVEYCPPDSRRRDAANIYPTVKAIVDGVVDAGVIPDDDTQHIDGPHMTIGAVSRPPTVVLAIAPLRAPRSAS